MRQVLERVKWQLCFRVTCDFSSQQSNLNEEFSKRESSSNILMSLRQSAASCNNSLSQPTHKPGVVHRGRAAELRASPRTRLQQSNRLRGPIENKSSLGLTRNSTGYGPDVVHERSTTMLSTVALTGNRTRSSSTKEGRQLQTRRSILGRHRSLRVSKKRGSR